MIQHMPSGRSKTFDLAAIVSVSKGKDAQVTVMVKENVRILTKRYTFHSVEDANRYHEVTTLPAVTVSWLCLLTPVFFCEQYVEFSRACGKMLRAIFDDIDKMRAGRITSLSLRRKMEAEDLQASDEQLDKMLNL